MTRLKVKDNPNLVRDPESNAIINVDALGYNEYLKKKRLVEEAEKEKHSLNRRINKLENDVGQLKDGIHQILELLKK